MPPPDQSIFMQSVAGRHNMFPGSSIGMTPNFNLGLGSGPEGMLAQMFVEPMVAGMVGPGFLPGQFNSTHNLYDHYRRRAQFSALQTSMAGAAERDQLQYVRLLRGMAATAGVSWNDERERAARTMAQDMSGISPMLAQVMPETFDQMHGARGSATMMAQNVFSGGRYRVDPITGVLGNSAETTAQYTREMYDRLYGPGADLVQMKGIGAGRAGQMYDEMSRRGMLPRAMSRDEQLSGVVRQELATKGLRGTEVEIGKVMDDLRGMSAPQLEMKVRQFEAGRITDRIKSMAGAVAAMKDVFGEMGRPDAPMNELIEGLQVLTQGGLATMTPGRVESIVRDAANLARRSGIGMDNMTVLMASAAQRADALGLDRSFGVTTGMQSAAFGSAYANMIGGGPAWGRGDKERMMAIDSQLRLNAANSPVANQFAATLRIGNEVGFKAGSEAEAVYAALKEGRETYSFGGSTKSVAVAAGRWNELMTAGGVDAGLASAYRAQTAYNQRTISENNLDSIARRTQAEVDAKPRWAQAYRDAAVDAGITDRALLDRIGTESAEGLFRGLSPDALQDPKAVADFLARRLGMDRGDATKMAQLERVASLGWGNLDQMVKTNPNLRGYKTADQWVTSQRYEVLRETANQVEEARQESRFQSALAGLGSGGPLARIMDAVSEATPGTSTRELIARTVGWVPEGEVGARLESTVRDMEAEIRKFRDTDPESVRAEVRAAGGDPIRLKALADKYTGGDVAALTSGGDLRARIRSSALNKIKAMSPELRRQAEAVGMETGAAASTGDAARVWTSLRDRRGTGVSELDDLTEKMLHDDRSMSVMGPDGLAVVSRVQGRNRSIRELANRTTGGDVGVLFSSTAQRARARELFSDLAKNNGEVRRLETAIREAEERGDISGANALRAELETASKAVMRAQDQLNVLGREAGTTGEALARASEPSAETAARVGSLREAQMADVGVIQERLKAGHKTDLTADQKAALTAERALRGRTDTQVMDAIVKSVGVGSTVSETDRKAIGEEVLRGDRGYAIRRAVPALQRLRTIKSGMSDEQFQAYLKRGPGAGASDEEIKLYHVVAAGRTGGGLAGITSGSSREQVIERLRDFAPEQRDAAPTPARGAPAGGDRTQRIEGTLTIPGLGEGRLHAYGSRR